MTNDSERVYKSKRNSGNTKSADARSSNDSPNCNSMYKYIKAAGLIVILLMLEITHIVIRIVIVIAIAIVITKRIQVLGLVQIGTLVDIRLVGFSSITIRCIVTSVVIVRSYNNTHRSKCKSTPN